MKRPEESWNMTIIYSGLLLLLLLLCACSPSPFAPPLPPLLTRRARHTHAVLEIFVCVLSSDPAVPFVSKAQRTRQMHPDDHVTGNLGPSTGDDQSVGVRTSPVHLENMRVAARQMQTYAVEAVSATPVRNSSSQNYPTYCLRQRRTVVMC